MSSENVDVVHRAIAAFSGGDVTAFQALSSPDIEWKTGLGALVGGEVFHGHEGVAAYFGQLASAWESFRFQADEYVDLGDVVLVLGRLEGHGRGGGVPVVSPVGAVWDLRDGLVWRLRAYLDRDAARAAAGLER